MFQITLGRGRWLIFGVNEQGDRLHVSGVEKPDSVPSDFLTVLRSGQKLNRKIAVEPRKYEIEGKHVFAFYIPQASRADKPVYLGGDLRQSYIRRGAGDERYPRRDRAFRTRCLSRTL